jgi:hypothetical protein
METPNASAAQTAEQTASRLRLKTVFLRTLVISLATCAFVAVVALLAGTFTELTGKVLITLGALALHSGLAMGCATSLERRRWPRWSVAGLVLFGLNFAIVIICTWWPGLFRFQGEKAYLETLALMGFYVLAIPCAELLEQGRWQKLAFGGLATSFIAFAMVLVCIWAEPTGSDAFPKATAIASIVAISLTQTCLVVRVPGSAQLGWLMYSTLAAVWAVAFLASAMIVTEPDHEFWFRLLGALGVLDATGSLALLIMAKLRQVSRAEVGLQTTPALIELRCPRCTASQVLTTGNGRCAVCDLRIRIEIEEPRCTKCDYLLWQLPERRCPECGTPF